MNKDFKHILKVYYEDTDAGGIVYYANYLKFLERARSEAIYSRGLSNKKLLDNFKTLIIVKSCYIEYIKPAKFEDKITILSSVKSFKNTSFTMVQKIERETDLIAQAEVVLVTVNNDGKPKKIPDKLKEIFC